MIDLSRSPFPITLRDLWLPRAINNNTSLPSSRYNGHPLTLTGARKGTTTDGVRGDGSATSNINCGAIHSNIAKLWVSLRFKLNQPFGAGLGDMYLWGKRIDGDNLLTVYLDNNGMLHFYMRTGAVDRFTLLSTITSWNANQWHHCIASLSDTAGGIQRLLVNNNLEDSDTQAAANTPNGGDLVLLDLADPGFGNGLKGIEADIFVGTDDLTATEETELYRGFPPADVVNEYLLDEGRGVTAVDRGSGGNNGTLDSACRWAYGECRHPVLSLDSLNDRGVSSAGISIMGDLTLFEVLKMKSTYNGLSTSRQLIRIYIAAGSYISLSYDQVEDEFIWYMIGGGTTQEVDYAVKPVIDDYLILIGTLTVGRIMAFYVNGSVVGVEIGAGTLPGLAATAYIGSTSVPSNYDISKPLAAGLIEGAITERQVLAFSRWLDRELVLGVGI